MQNIPNNVIGAMLHRIWHGNPDAAPPIHIWTKETPQGCLFLEINTFMEHVEAGTKLPSAVMILTFNTRMGGGPYLLYWVADPQRTDLAEKVAEWQARFRGYDAQEILSMGIGNSLA